MWEEARSDDDDEGGRSDVTAEYADRTHGSEERRTARRTRPRIAGGRIKNYDAAEDYFFSSRYLRYLSGQ